MDLNNTYSFSSHSSADLNLETVRALHQTVVALRSALEQSRSELFELRVKVHSNSNTKVYADTIEKLALENHILRERVLASRIGRAMEEQANACESTPTSSSEPVREQSIAVEPVDRNTESKEAEDDALLPTKAETVSESEEKDPIRNEEKEENPEYEAGVRLDTGEHQNISEKSSPAEEEQLENDKLSGAQECDNEDQINGIKPKTNEESDNESEELDDIELIFTTEETKELGVMQEDLVSISDTDNWAAVNGQPSLPVTVEKSTQFDEESTGLRMPWAHTVVVETDISKCGIIDENEVPPNNNLRRNTLPSPMPYRPIIHKEVLSSSKSPSHTIKFSTSRSPRPSGSSDTKRLPMRPILVEPNSSPKCESEAQTDITALPSHWKSESYLAHKVSHPFTTLPSKFTLPTRQAMQSRPSLKICDRSQDARRILLSDINFTSMVPELSRSADHLALESGATAPVDSGGLAPTVAGLYRNFPRAFSYMKNPDIMGPCLVSPGYQHTREYGRFQWSPCDCVTQGKWEYPSRYQSTQSSATSPQPPDVDVKQRPDIKPSSSLLEVCRHGHLIQRSVSSSSWQSEPASPTRCLLHNRTRSVPLTSSYMQSRSKLAGPTISWGYRYSPSSSFGPSVNRARSKVSFQENCLRRQGRGGQSLPDLRITDAQADSGDSTDSLIDEAEDYVRRSIDSISTGVDLSRISRRRMARRHSDPDPLRDLIALKTAQPFLPKSINDLKLDHLVKIITSDGRVTVGKIRYVGAVAGLSDPHVGVELTTGSGDSDGSFRGRRYFECEPSHSLFVPFKKVVMAWKT
ncbi:Dynactin, 150 kDa isoform [Frankliniella fusca]|uniref:Dynactin, 150 kDa isoform n=1 Tax=Frankliniella fusca TaxID=407009 RepID=A0AAE1GZ14_9NEOP|nr:Dynactin, 150 kDa isoform [Frankliniella fusca]